MLPQLTEREEEVLKLIAHGLTNRQLAGLLSISEATVENHVHHIYLKLGITNRAQAVLHALQKEGMLEPKTTVREERVEERLPEEKPPVAMR